jgi:hypothetical protein
VGARVTGCEVDVRAAVVGGRALDVAGGRRRVDGAREFVRLVVRVPGVVRCAAGRGVGLLVTADFCFRLVGGWGLTCGSGLARAKGPSSSE